MATANEKANYEIHLADNRRITIDASVLSSVTGPKDGVMTFAHVDGRVTYLSMANIIRVEKTPIASPGAFSGIEVAEEAE